MESCRRDLEEGLTLFQHMRAREDKNYLNNCNDDIEEIKYEDGLSTFRISASTPTRSGGLLVFDAEKNDYDWLVTPPGTPLFPCLDHETVIVNVSQRPSFTGSASASEMSKEPASKSFSELPSAHQLSRVQMARNTPSRAHASPSPTREKAASPSRTSTSSSKARSPSPSPSSIKSHPSSGAFSHGRPSTPYIPARASKSCQNNLSPLVASGHGYSARRGPRRSLSPRLGSWEPALGACSTDPLPNLRTSPSNRSLQRGSAEGSAKGASSRISGSSLEATLNCNRPKWRAMSADNIESYSLPNKLKQIRKDFPDAKSEIAVRRNVNKGLSMSTMSLSEDSRNSSYVRRRAPLSTWGKEVISNFADAKLLEQHTVMKSNVSSLHNMFRPSVLSTPATLYHKTKLEPSNFDMSSNVSPYMVGNGGSKWYSKVLPDNRAAEHGQLSHKLSSVDGAAEHRQLSHRLSSVDNGLATGSYGPRKMAFPCKNGHTLDEASRTKFGEEAGAACAEVENPMLNIEHLGNKSQSSSKKDAMGLACESLSPQASKNRLSSSQLHGARLPVRRQLTMANADVGFGTWSMNKTESFDISTSDSHSCSESMDSSYVDNRTEKFSEDLSEVDSMSHTGYSNSNSSATNYSPRNYVRVATKLLKESCENEQGMQAGTHSMDPSRFSKPSNDYHYPISVYGNDRLSLEDAHIFMEALNLKQSQPSAELLCTSVDAKGKYQATGQNVNSRDMGRDKYYAVKSTLARAVMEETREWDERCKQVLPHTSPLKRNVTLEEATDTILFCSSIVHEIVYGAASLAEEKCIMNSEDSAKVCGLMCTSESSRSSPCWTWNRRRTPLHNVVQKIVDRKPQPEIRQSVQSSSIIQASSLHAAEDLQQKSRKKKSGLCCFS